MNQKISFRDRMQNGFVIFDGATGSNLQNSGMPSGVSPEKWILEHPQVLIDLQKKYIEAGTQVLLASTFTCNRIKLKEYGLENELENLNEQLIGITKKAISESGCNDIYVACDISMTGESLYPMGTLLFEELVEVYKEQVRVACKCGVDLFVIETMMSLQECRAAVLAVKETCDLPVVVSLTYQEDLRTLYGTNPETATIVLQGMGVDAIGINCSAGPKQMLPAIEQMAAVTQIPILAKPNAGLPKLENGCTTYDLSAEEFADAMVLLMEKGATMVGGCCGTTPEHIRALADRVQKQVFMLPDFTKKIRALSNERNTVYISLDGQLQVVGERINPTGKKMLQEQLKQGKWDLVLSMAEEQVKAGASLLDVNMGMNGIDEKESMIGAIYELSQHVDVPLSIDSSYVDVVEEALRIYPGRALINSISLEPQKIEKLIPVARKYGAMFILLPLSEKGLPKDLDEKKKIIHAILDCALKVGLTKEDIVVDGLVTTIGANKNAANEVFETIEYCKNQLGLATICGLSNISFGLPQRQFINSTFLALAIGKGLTMAIANPTQTLLMNSALASDLLLNKEGSDLAYIENVAEADVSTATKTASGETKETMPPIMQAVVKGRKEAILSLVEEKLKENVNPQTIINEFLIPGINYVGKMFEEKKYYLPQLISSAETMEMAIRLLEPLIEKQRNGEKKETIIMATVKGDIHDIGKNLVSLMLRNYGYDVIDMGKDVDCEDIIQKAKETNASIIGLSALMTTTMMAMKDVVELAKKENVKASIIIGGAVVTDGFASEIGADGYSEDASEAVKLVSRLLQA